MGILYLVSDNKMLDNQQILQSITNDGIRRSSQINKQNASLEKSPKK